MELLLSEGKTMDHRCKEKVSNTGDAYLSMSPELIRRLGYRIVDMIVEDLADTGRRPPFPLPRSMEDLAEVLGGPPPQEGMDPEDILGIIEKRFIPACGNHNHPCLMANVLTGAVPLAGLMEALIGTLKVRPTTWRNQPASCFVEVTVARWLGEMVGFAKDAAGYMTTGGSWANLVGIAMARVCCAGWDVRSDGVSGHTPLVAYTSEEAHSCFDRAAELLGIGREGLRKIPAGQDFRIKTDVLEETIRRDLKTGLKPFCIVGQAGTINTGTVDDLTALADIAQRYGLWFHIDGSYGALAALNPQARHLLAGIERADSLSVDPHKWLNTPFEAGCILAKDWECLGKTFGVVPPYLRAQLGGAHDQFQYGFELSRVDRALKVWIALKQYGIRRYGRMIAGHMALAKYMADLIRDAEDLEIMSEPVLSICCFRYVPQGMNRKDKRPDRYLDGLNRAIEDTLAAGAQALVSGTELQGRFVLRACIASYQVTREGVETTLDIVRRTGSQLHATMQG